MTDLPVEVIRSARRKRTVQAALVDGTIQVRVPAGLPPLKEQELVDNMVATVTRKAMAGEVDLPDRARELARSYGLPVPDSIEWSNRQLRRWGSCSPSQGTIRISARLAGVPGWVLDFVILHELAHLVANGHGPEFKELVGRYQLAERAEGYLLALTHMPQG